MISSLLSAAAGCGALRGSTNEIQSMSFEGTDIRSGGGSIFDSSNAMNTDYSRFARNDVERISVFVEPPTIGGIGSSTVSANKDALLSTMHDSMKNAVMRYGRFHRVDSPAQAEIIISPQIRSTILWIDASKGDEGGRAGTVDISGSGRNAFDIKRQGVDLLVNVEFKDAAGRVIHGTLVSGRIISQTGSLLSEGTLISPSAIGHGSSVRQVENATINVDYLPRLFESTADGAMVVAFRTLDPMLWSREKNQLGMHPKTCLNLFAGTDTTDR